MSDRGQQSQFGRAEAGAAAQQDVADDDVLARAAHVGARPHGLVDDEDVALLAGELDGHDRVDAVGQGCAGHDLGRGALRHGRRRRLARGQLDDDGEAAAPGLQLGAAHGEAVHRGVVEGRHPLPRDDVPGGRAAEGFEQGDLLGRQRPHAGQHDIQRFIYGDHGRLPCCVSSVYAS